MHARELPLSRLSNQEKGRGCERIFLDWGAKGILILLSCLWVWGCSTPDETRPEPSKEEIRSDADRFFKKMEQEKRGELKR